MKESNWARASGEVALYLDLRGSQPSDYDATGLNTWLAQQPVPLVALVDDNSPAADGLDGFDVVVNDTDRLEQIQQQIIKRPQASATLVQVTRATVLLPMASALHVESMGYGALQGGAEFATWLEQSPHRNKEISVTGEPVMLDRQADHLSIRLNDPANRNALSAPMRDALSEAFALVAQDDSIKQVSVTGEGDNFCAGGDLREFGSVASTADAHQIRQLAMPAQYLAPYAERFTFYLHGGCIGAGIELPSFAGRVVAARDAWFRLPEINMGLIPGAGGCVSIPRRIGRQRTNELAITGRDLPASEALVWGLIDAIE